MSATPLAERVRAFYEGRHSAYFDRPRRYYHRYLTRVLQVRIPPGQRVLEIGCGTGELLADLRPAYGVGIDLSARAVAAARERHPGQPLHFLEGDGGDPRMLSRTGGRFDAIVMVNVVTQLEDPLRTLESLHAVCHHRTRIFVYSYSRLWQPLLRLAELLRMREREPPDAWLPPEELRHQMALADFELVRTDRTIVMPVPLPLVADVVNRYVGHLPLVEHLALMFGVIARPAPHRNPGARASRPSVSVVIPCRNEAGHVAELVSRLPDLGPGSEFIFVEGNSRDDTEAAIRRAIAENPERPLRLVKQHDEGKGPAVRLGFAEARGHVLAILDGDMGVAPEDLPRFVDLLVRGKGELVNGSRLVYPMEARAMRFLNLVANKAFAVLFSWLLGQQVRDTLCGTKALYREDYERIVAGRSYFGDFDPFGDFDLLFGASRLSLRIVDLAVRYRQRRYGHTNIARFRHGLILLRMWLFAVRRLRAL